MAGRNQGVLFLKIRFIAAAADTLGGSTEPLAGSTAELGGVNKLGCVIDLFAGFGEGDETV